MEIIMSINNNQYFYFMNWLCSIILLLFQTSSNFQTTPAFIAYAQHQQMD